ncbi:MAG: hypothetical protein AAF089_18150 [Bacteroidota bacterium]
MDLSFYLSPPERTVRADLVVEALAPLSLVSAQPGSYYQSAPAPSEVMLLGMIENALGWHLGYDDRKAALASLQKQAKRAHSKSEWAGSPWLTAKPKELLSDSGYLPLLPHHLAFDGLREIPPVLGYDDLWARQQRDPEGRVFFNGSRRYDATIESAITRSKQGHLSFGDRSQHETLDPREVVAAPDGALIHYKSVRSRFPQYSVSPTPRGYVVPLGVYRFGVSTTPAVSDLIAAALDDPAAPLYLGSNDGWVDAQWEVL